MGNGLGSGTCSICFFGLLPGWGHGYNLKCGYKGCSAEPVARGIRGKSFVCVNHFNLQHGADYLSKRLEDRNKEWVLVEESINSPY